MLSKGTTGVQLGSGILTNTFTPQKWGKFLLNGGVFIASRHKIEAKSDWIMYTNSTSSDAMAKKGFGYVTISKSGTKYHILGSHTQASYIKKNGGKVADQLKPYRESRKQQAKQMKTQIDEWNFPKSEALILGGDLNEDWVRFKDATEEYLDEIKMKNPGDKAGSSAASGVPGGQTANPQCSVSTKGVPLNVLVGMDGEAEDQGCQAR